MSGAPFRRRPALDVSGLPTTAYGLRDIMAWGTLGFILAEGFTLALCVTAWIYTTENFRKWPPEGTMLPSLVVPTIQVALMLASLPVMAWLKRAAYRKELAKVRWGLTIGTLFTIAFDVLRYWELTRSLNVKWDANAYGSVQWLVVAAHGTLLAMQTVETAGMAAIFWLGPVEKKHFPDSADVAVYWLFIVLSWVPLYALCFLLPHWIAR